MPQEQRYEYKSVTVNVFEFPDADDKLNELAADGWKLQEKVDLSGNTAYFIFERPVA